MLRKQALNVAKDHPKGSHARVIRQLVRRLDEREKLLKMAEDVVFDLTTKGRW